MEDSDENVLPFPMPWQRIAPATAYRSTWIVSSIGTLRERGHYDAYTEALASHRDEILGCVAGAWLPMLVVRAHYEACDTLGFSTDEILAMGRASGARAQASLLATAVKFARAAGATPWTILPQVDRLYRRGSNGGAAGVFRVGPKEARIEFVGCELFDVSYFRVGFRAVLHGIGEMFCQKVYVHDVPQQVSGRAIYRMQWV